MSSEPMTAPDDLWPGNRRKGGAPPWEALYDVGYYLTHLDGEPLPVVVETDPAGTPVYAAFGRLMFEKMRSVRGGRLYADQVLGSAAYRIVLCTDPYINRAAARPSLGRIYRGSYSYIGGVLTLSLFGLDQPQASAQGAVITVQWEGYTLRFERYRGFLRSDPA